MSVLSVVCYIIVDFDRLLNELDDIYCLFLKFVEDSIFSVCFERARLSYYCIPGPIEPSRGKPTMWFPSSSDTNRPVQAQKRARSLKFRI